MEKHIKIIQMETDSEDDEESDVDEKAQMAIQDKSRNNLEIPHDFALSRKDHANALKKKKMDFSEIVGSKCELSWKIPDRCIEINNVTFKTTADFVKKVNECKNLKHLKIYNCSIETMNHEVLPFINSLTSVVLSKCDENIIKVFENQKTIQQFEVNNDAKNCKEFPHDIFNEICRNSKSLNQIILKGPETSRYFDSDEFPFKIKCLETSAISHNWFVGLKEPRIKFLESQKGSLKELTIHELPLDFDGGEVLKYIFNEMKLETFYYGKTPLIVDGQKTKIKKFTATEIQITSSIEMLKQLPSIKKFTLKISSTEISSDHIEIVLNSSGNVFNNLKELVVIDNSRGSLGVFMGIFKNLRSLQKLTLNTNNRFINTILICLPIMPNLEEIQIIITAPKALQRYEAINKFAPNLRIIKVPEISVGEAKGSFGDKVAAIDEANAPCSSTTQRAQKRTEKRRSKSRDNDDDDSNDEDDSYESDPPDTTSPGIIEEKKETLLISSPVQNQNVNGHIKLRVHVYKYPRHIVTWTNMDELIKLIENEEFFNQILYLIIENEMFVVHFKEDGDDFPSQFKIKIDELAYRLLIKSHQLPLLTITSNLRIMICCCIKKNVNGDLFVRKLACQNKLNGSHWVYHNTTLVDNQHQISFFVDAISFSSIEEKEYFLKYQGDRIQVKVA